MKTIPNVSLRRIGLLINQDIQYLWKAALLMLSGLYIIATIYFYLVISAALSLYRENGDYDNPLHPGYYIMHPPIFLLGLAVGAALSGALLFREYSSKATKKHYLSLPASTSEKWLAKFLLSAIIIPFLIIVSYQLFTYIINGMIWQTFGIELNDYNIFELFFTSPFFLLYYIVNAIFFWGSITFERLAFFKTLLFVAIGYFIVAVIYLVCINTFIPELDGYWNILDLNFSTRLKKYYFKDQPNLLSDRYANKVIAITFVMAMTLLILSSYFKLKEKQV